MVEFAHSKMTSLLSVDSSRESEDYDESAKER